MEVVNDNTCSWINDLTPRSNIQSITSNLDCEWLVIGAGYTGLSAARKLGQLYPNQKTLLVDAQLAGEGASSRNSGYLVDTTLNDGFTSNKKLEICRSCDKFIHATQMCKSCGCFMPLKVITPLPCPEKKWIY